MNRSASAAYYPFQVMPRFLLGRQGEVYYIGGSDILPPPLESQKRNKGSWKNWVHQRRKKLSLSLIESTNLEAGGLYYEEI